MRKTLILLFSLSFFSGVCRGQEAAAPVPDLGAKRTLLQNALTTTAELPSGAFTTTHSTSSQILRQLNRGAPKEQLQGGWGQGLLFASSSDGKDTLVSGGRRSIARSGQDEWRIRRSLLVDGRPMPFVFDPQAFCAQLAVTQYDVLQAAAGALDDRPVETVTIHLEGDAALELVWSGLLPEGSDPFGRSVVFRVAGGAVPAPPKPDLALDVAVAIDPATRLVHRIHLKSYTKSKVMGAAGVQVAFAGGVVVAGANAGEEEEEEDEDKVEPANKPLVFKDGLPVRKHKKTEQPVTVTFEARLSEHGSAKPIELDAKARQLLGLPAAK